MGGEHGWHWWPVRQGPRRLERVWNSSEAEGLGHDNYIYAAGTPHHEQFVVGRGLRLPGKHATDSFIDGGENLKDALLDDKDFPWFYRFDGSTTMVRQCNGDLIGNDGAVIWMRLRPEPGLAASQHGASDGSPRAFDNAEPIAVTQAIERACETDNVPKFDHYFLGGQFAGLALTGRRRSCEPPPAVVRSDAGALVHECPVRVNDVAYVYGDCALPAKSEGGCVPPLQIISSPGCERPHSLYRRYIGPPELGLGPEPHQDVEFRGVKMSVFDQGTRLELYTGDATVTIAANTATRVAQAALAMVAAPSSRSGQRAGGAALPQANPGVADEDLPQSKAPPAC